MVDIVVYGVIGENHLERVPGKAVAAVVIHGLHCRKHVDEEGLSRRELCDDAGNTGAHSIEQEAFHRVVVKRAVGVRNVEAVVSRVEPLVERLVQVHRPVEPVLPGIDDAKGKAHSEHQPAVSVGEPEHRVRHPGGGPVVLKVPYLIELVARGGRGVYTINSVSDHQLDDVLDDNIVQHVTQRSLVPQLLLLGRMDPVLLRKLVNVNEMEKRGVGPVGYNGSKDG